MQVDWGDGTTSTVNSYDQRSHDYDTAGTYTITINGLIDGWSFKFYSQAEKLLEISQWGSLKLGDGGGQFYGCTYLVLTATDTLDVSHVTTMSSMFYYASSFNGDL